MKLIIEPSLAPADEQIIGRGLRQSNEAHVSGAGDSSFAVFLRDGHGVVLGGVLAKAERGWLYITTHWVDASVRGTGIRNPTHDRRRSRGATPRLSQRLSGHLQLSSTPLL